MEFVLFATGMLAATAHAEYSDLITTESIFLRDVEVIQGDNILFIDRIVSARVYGVDEEIALRMLKLANGQLLYGAQWLSPKAREFNARMCERMGKLPPDSDFNIIVDGPGAIPGRCAPNAADIERIEKRLGRPLRRNGNPRNESATDQPDVESSVGERSYPCVMELSSSAPWTVPVSTIFPYGLDYSVTIPGDGPFGEFSVSGGIGGLCSVNASGHGSGGFEVAETLWTACYASRIGVLRGGASGTVYRNSDRCSDYDSVLVNVY